MLRLATAAVLAPTMWALVKLAPPGVFFVAVALIILLGAFECYAMLARIGLAPFTVLGLAACLAMAASFASWPGAFGAGLPLSFVLIIAVVLGLWRREGPQAVVESALATLFPVIFVALNLSYLIALRGTSSEDGADLLLLLLLCVISADTAAYYAGSAFGRRRLAPRISPGKTWEGAIAGVVASIGAACLGPLWFYHRLPLGHALGLGLLLAISGIFGDLAESALKRAAGMKDSSRLVPGHGGVLDRIDSLLFAAPVLYCYHRLFLFGG
jgi:phosphatidate cytidylyltransferase